MVTHTRNWSSAFNPSKCTHRAVSSEHTHCEHAPRAVGSHCSSARGAVGGSVPCSRAPQSWYWGWRECCSFTIPTFSPCRTWDSNPQPLDYKSDSLTIRPRLPQWKVKVMWHTYSQVWWPILGIRALHLTHPTCTHTAVNTHTHTVNTHPEQWAANAAAPGEQLGVRCLAQGHLSRGSEGEESTLHSLPPPTIPVGPETRTLNL